MGCNSCKSKPANNITNLQEAIGGVNKEELTLAYQYTQIISKMDENKWDLVEKVVQDIYPGTPPLQRNCKSCLEKFVRLINYHYNQSKVKK